MIREYAITPQVFDRTNYVDDQAFQRAIIPLLKELERYAVVRDLHDGDWRTRLKHLLENRSSFDLLSGKVILALLMRQRLCLSPRGLERSPDKEDEWLAEAIAAHQSRPVTGIIAKTLSNPVDDQAIPVVEIDNLQLADWWLGLESTCSVRRTSDAYLKALDPIIKYSTCIHFVDPNIDPEHPNYSHFWSLIRAVKDRNRKPCAIYVHRAVFARYKKYKQHKSLEDWILIFQALCNQAQYPITLVLRDEEIMTQGEGKPHDRYLLSNLAAIGLSNGFDVDRGPHPSRVTFAFLDRETETACRRFFEKLNGCGITEIPMNPLSQ